VTGRWTVPRLARRPGAGWLVVGAVPLALFLGFIGVPLVALIVRGVGEDGF